MAVEYIEVQTRSSYIIYTAICTVIVNRKIRGGHVLSRMTEDQNLCFHSRTVGRTGSQKRLFGRENDW